ncbi:(S)-benzoin forming benzil reductase [Paenibacillus senegalensis]|uniref:(S)-benzoin forming benzil reductase n=1 Tax=Paenibacillus senegalensis TaxID=1465766 RepID=UPI000289264B|nr:(S)-benzoin forming benzil reductase [Paenibacillus senegalensis]
MNLFVVTGASRGLGHAIARRLLLPGNYVIGLSRSSSEQLSKEASLSGARYESVEVDLSRVDSLADQMEQILQKAAVESLKSACLINNAGVLSPTGPIENAPAEEIAYHMQVNLTAPIILSSSFIHNTEAWEVPKTIMNISSGAGRKPYSGWSSYCASKAGLDHFTRCVGLEQQDKPYGVRMISVAPGVIDTDMQSYIRSLSEQDFPQKERFIQLKEQGQLSSPEDAADKLLKLLNSGDYGHGDILDVRQ